MNEDLVLVFHNLPGNRIVRGATVRTLQKALALLHHAIKGDEVGGTAHVVLFPGGLVAQDGSSYDAYLCTPGYPAWSEIEKWIDADTEAAIALSGAAIVANAQAYGEYGAILNLAETFYHELLHLKGLSHAEILPRLESFLRRAVQVSVSLFPTQSAPNLHQLLEIMVARLPQTCRDDV